MPKLPKEVIDHWPEVLKDVDVEVLPIEYLHSLRVSFADGRIWEIDCRKNPEGVDLETAIEDLLEEYEEEIVNVDFRLDTERVKKDIQNRTKLFLKKRK